MKYCTQCGNPIQESEGRICEPCLASSEAAVSVALEPVYGEQGAQAWRSYLDLAKRLLLSPDRSIAQIAYFRNVVPGAVFAVVSSILLSLISLLYMNQVIKQLSKVVNSALGMFSPFNSKHNLDIPYFEVFIKLTFGFIVLWVLLSFAIWAIVRLFKISISPVQALNIVGVTKIYLILGSLLMLVLGMLHYFVGIGLLFASIILGYIAIHKGIKPLVASYSKGFYILPSAIVLYLVCEMIIIKLMV